MTRSIAARYTARPAARFAHAPARQGERLFGLLRPGAIQPAPRMPAFLEGAEPASVARLHRAGTSPRVDGRVARSLALGARPRIHWTRQDARPQAFRSGVASASWRA